MADARRERAHIQRDNRYRAVLRGVEFPLRRPVYRLVPPHGAAESFPFKPATEQTTRCWSPTVVAAEYTSRQAATSPETPLIAGK